MGNDSIRNIWAVGRNYADHVKEMNAMHAPPAGGGTGTSAPLVFLKAGSTVVQNGDVVRLPKFSNDVHHEVEIALRFSFLNPLFPSFSPGLSFDAVTVALDLTARDVQAELKAKSQPWTLAKSFIDSCPLGDWVDLSKLGSSAAAIEKNLQNLSFAFEVNGERRQSGNARDMIHSIHKLARYVCENFPVRPGDILLTGTPAGVGPIRSGDHLVARIGDFIEANWTVG